MVLDGWLAGWLSGCLFQRVEVLGQVLSGWQELLLLVPLLPAGRAHLHLLGLHLCMLIFRPDLVLHAHRSNQLDRMQLGPLLQHHHELR